MSLRIRDAGGTLRTVAAMRIRDASGTLRTIASGRIRDAAGTLREFLTSGGGGGGGGGPSVWADPASKSTFSSAALSSTFDFVANYSGSTAPTSYAWSIVSVTGGTASIISGASTATARIRVTAAGSAEAVEAHAKCVVTIGGTAYEAFVTFRHFYAPSGGGGGGGGGGDILV